MIFNSDKKSTLYKHMYTVYAQNVFKLFEAE